MLQQKLIIGQIIKTNNKKVIPTWIESKHFLIELKQFKTIPKTIKLKKSVQFFKLPLLVNFQYIRCNKNEYLLFWKMSFKIPMVVVKFFVNFWHICYIITSIFSSLKNSNFQNIFFHQKKLPTVIKKIAPIQYLKLRFVKMFSYIILFFNINIKKIHCCISYFLIF